MTTPLGGKPLNDVLTNYRPVALLLGFVLLVLMVVPGASGDDGGTSGDGPASQPAFTTDPEPIETIPDTGAPVVPAEEQSFPAFVAPAPPADSPTYEAPSTSSGSGTTPRPTTTTTLPADPQLTIVASGWATANAGTPVATSGVPEKSLPVGKRAGSTDKISFVRLSGNSARLILKIAEGGDPTSQRNAETASLSACPISERGWTAREAVALEDAPKYDCALAAGGKRLADGRWTFDLSAFPDRTGPGGFALVPGPNAPIDFQVAFANRT